MPNLSDQLQSLIEPLRNLEQQNGRLFEKGLFANQKVVELQAEVDRLNKLLAPSPPRPTDPPIDHAPNVTITFGSHILKPYGVGELWPLSGERRWFWDVDSQVRVILDAKSDGLNSQDQVRIILQYCWADEKTTKVSGLPPYTSHVKVEIDNQVMYDAPIRLHYGQRPPKTFRRYKVVIPTQDLGWKMSATFPNYHIGDKALPIADMVTPKNWYWQGWEEVNQSSTYDAWSETYGFVVASWTGGGAPSANEASMFSPWDVALLLSGDSRLADKCLHTADTSGNYLIHYYSRESGQSYTYLDSAKLPFTLVETNLPSSSTVSGKKLPIPDLAHCLGIPDLAALVTGERFYIEELESWVLIGSLCRHAGRSSGIYFSGQIRATAWWLRNLYHLVLALPDGAIKALYEAQLVANLKFLSSFSDQSSPNYKVDGVLSTLTIRPSPMTKYADPIAKDQINTGNLFFLLYVLSEIYQAGYREALPMIRLLTNTSHQIWLHTPNHLLAPWFQHIYLPGGWDKIIAATFHSAPDSLLKATSWKDTGVYIDYIAWYRAGLVAVIDCLPEGDSLWAREALQWIDGQLAREGRLLPIAWAVEPRKG